MISNFKGKTAVLTGAGSGFGLECARIGAKLGMNLVLVDVQKDALDAAEVELKATGVQVMARLVNVSDANQMQALANDVQATFGAPHFVFNNAGVAAGGLVWESSLADWEWVMGVNLWGVVNGVRLFTPMMLEAAAKDPHFQGHIVNTASMAGLLTPPNMGIYNVSKHAVVGLTRCVALEASPYAVTVNAICPGFVQTDMVDELKAQVSQTTGLSPDDMVKAALTRVPLGRILNPSEIAGLAVYLGSAESSGMTGQSVHVDGGMVLS